MRTISEIKTEVLLKLGASTSVGFYSDTILNKWIDDAHKWAAGFKKWSVTEGRTSTTFASLSTNQDGWLTGQYPEGWKPESIRLLTVGGKRIGKRDFYKFQEFLEENESATNRIYTDRGREYFINPNIDISGSVVVWGQYTPVKFDSTDDDPDTGATTVFSDGLEDANEAIVDEVMRYASKREQKKKEADAFHEDAKNGLNAIWQQILDEQYQYKVTDDDGMFKRFDVLKGGFKEDFTRNQF